jgi:hypothetical protein
MIEMRYRRQARGTAISFRNHLLSDAFQLELGIAELAINSSTTLDQLAIPSKTSSPTILNTNPHQSEYGGRQEAAGGSNSKSFTPHVCR